MGKTDKAKDSFVVFTDWAQPMKSLPLDDVGRLFLAMVEYTESGKVPEIESPSAAMAFEFIRLRLDDNRQKWEDVRQRRSEAGRRGAEATNSKVRQKAANAANADFAENTSVNPAVPVTVPVLVNSIGAEPPQQKRFIPPTIEEVAAYCQKRGNGVDANRFVSHYAAIGWMIGKNKMRDWQAAVRTWERNNQQTPQPQTASKQGRADRDL